MIGIRSEMIRFRLFISGKWVTLAVALYVSAWIEMIERLAKYERGRVALYVSAWIEIVSSSEFGSIIKWSHSM